MRKAIRSPLLALALIVVFAGTVLATAASGFHSTILFRGTISERVHVNTHAVRSGRGSVWTSSIKWSPSNAAGLVQSWHAHWVCVIVTVVMGSVVNITRTVATVHAAPHSAESGHDAGLWFATRVHDPATVVKFRLTLFPSSTGTLNTALRSHKANPGCPQN